MPIPLASTSMQLCLVNNDPISTLLITPEGEPIFAIETLPLLPSTLQPHPQVSSPIDKTRANSAGDAAALDPSFPPSTSLSSSTARQRSQTTTIKRIERHRRSSGQVETEIGVVEYRGPKVGTHLQLCAQNHVLAIAERRTTKQIPGRTEEEEDQDEGEGFENTISWEFTGPDTRRYRWQVFVHSPVLLTADNTFTPLARYRRAKIGIVSRSRRASLEILPAGINLIDLIVVTFVGFMKQRVLVEGAVYDGAPDSNSTTTPTPIV